MKSKGFTLVEVLVAMTVLSTGIIGVLGAFSLSLRAGGGSQRYSQAVEIAERELELACASADGEVRTGSHSDGGFTWIVSGKNVSRELKLAKIDVKWTAQGASRSFQLSRLFVPLNRKE